MQLQANGSGHLIMTLDAKDFSLGLSPLQQSQNNTGGTFATALGIDPYRFPGMISPGPLPTAFTGNALTGTPYSMAFVDNDQQFGSWLMTTTGLFSFSQSGVVQNAQLASAFNSLPTHPFNTYWSSSVTVSYPHSILRINNGNAFANDSQGNFSSPGEMLYFTDTDIGYFAATPANLGSTMVDNWGSGTGATLLKFGNIHVPNGNATLQSAIHRAVIYNRFVVFTNGTTLGALDTSTQTSTSTFYTLNTAAFTLPTGFQARDIRIEGGLIQALCDNGNGNTSNPSKIILVTWDGVNPLAQDITEIDDNMAMASTNINGFPVLVTKGRGFGNAIRKKDYWGWPQVQFLKTSSLATRDVYPSLIETSGGQLIISSQSGNQIFYYGSPFGTYSYRGTDNTGTFPDALNNPFVSSGSAMQALTMAQGKLFSASTTSGTTFGEYFPITGYTSYNNPKSTFQTNFFPLPKRCTVNWIKFSILPLTGNEAFTPQLLIDYATTPISMQNGDLTPASLDPNVNAKTYLDIGVACNSLAIGGNWIHSSTNSSTVIISRIDVGLTIS